MRKVWAFLDLDLWVRATTYVESSWSRNDRSAGVGVGVWGEHRPSWTLVLLKLDNPPGRCGQCVSG
jgi:hypothetical protein